MRPQIALIALLGAFAIPASALAQSAFYKNRDREEKIDLNDPFDPKAKIDPRKGTWKERAITYTVDGADISRRLSEITRFQWKDEPAIMAEARAQVVAGQYAKALASIEIVLRKFDPVKKVPGSLWLKAAELKLDALSGLSSESQLSAFINVLEQNDDGSVPGLAAKIKLARLTLLVRAGDHTGVLVEVDKLIPQLQEPEAQARLLLFKADAQYALRRYEDAVKTYLRVPVFYGAEKAFMPAAYLGAAQAFRGLDGPATRGQELHKVASEYLIRVIREFPLSKEAAAARELLPPEERAEEEKRMASQKAEEPLVTTTPAEPATKTDAPASETAAAPAADAEKPADAPADETTKPKGKKKK